MFKQRILCLLLTIALFCSLAACASNNPTSSTTRGTTTSGTTTASGTTRPDYLSDEGAYPYQIVKEGADITLDINAFVSDATLEPEKVWIWKWLQEVTNVKLNVTHIGSSAKNEKKSIMFASDALPDILWGFGSALSTTELATFGEGAGMLLALNDYFDDYGKDIKRELDAAPIVKAAITTPDGNIYSVPSLRVGIDEIQKDGSSSAFTWINAKWIENAGLDQPKTLDDLYNILKAFKETDVNMNGDPNDEIPLSGTNANFAFVLAALGLKSHSPTTLGIDDGEVILPAAEPVYEQYLRYMNRLYTEALLDQACYTQTSTELNAKGAEKRIGMQQVTGHFVAFPNSYHEYVFLTPLTSEWNNDQILVRDNDYQVGTMVVSAKTEYPEVCTMLMNLYFLDTLNPLIEGPQKGSVDCLGFGGHLADENGQLTYEMPPECQSVWEYRFKYLCTWDGSTAGLNNSKYRAQLYKYADGDQDFREKEYDINPKQYFVPSFPTVYMTTEQNGRAAQLSATLNDYISIMSAKYITGTESFDSIETYFAELNTLGIDEYLGIYQDALDK